MRHVIALTLALCACDSPAPETPDPDPDPREVERRVEAAVTARLAHEERAGYLGCILRTKDEINACIHSAVRRGESNSQFECARTANTAKRVCARIYHHTFSDFPPKLSPTPGGAFTWLEDDLVPKEIIDCPEDLKGPRYVELRRKYQLPAPCIRNEVTGEIW